MRHFRFSTYVCTVATLGWAFTLYAWLAARDSSSRGIAGIAFRFGLIFWIAAGLIALLAFGVFRWVTRKRTDAGRPVDRAPFPGMATIAA